LSAGSIIPSFISNGYCEDCHHSQVVQDLESFEKGCRRADLNTRLPADENDIRCRREDKFFFYNTTRILKVVHLVRNPFDNIVARMHLGVKQKRREGTVGENILSRFNNSIQGVRAWCDYVDEVFHDESSLYKHDGAFRGKPSDASVRNVTISNATMELMGNTSCHSEIFRYVQWHSLAIDVYRRKLRTISDGYVVYYEDYAQDLTRASQTLGDFLELPIVRDPLPFESGKVYTHCFTTEERIQMSRLIRALATPDCWSMLSRYFEGWFDGKEVEVANKKPENRAALSEYSRNEGDGSESSTPNSTKVVWLLSFPKSGSYLTLHGVKAMTDAEVASHNFQDGPGQDPIWENVTNSPILVDPPGDYIPRRVLTRNQCTGFCPFCKPAESQKQFDRMCWTVTRKIGGNKKTGEYPRKLVDGAVFIIRNPFDVIRSRSSIGIFEARVTRTLGITERQAAKLQDTREGLEKWCQVVDANFAEKDEGPPELPSRPRAEPTWNTLYRSLIRARKWRSRRYHCPNLLFPVDKRYSLFGRNISREMREFPIDRKRLSEYRSIPCYSDWLRYINWHNYALQQIRHQSVYVMHFEKYEKSPQRALSEVIKYLNLTAVRRAPELDRRRLQHMQLYTPDEVRQLAFMVREFGSEEVWELLRHYFEGYDGDSFDAAVA